MNGLKTASEPGTGAQSGHMQAGRAFPVLSDLDLVSRTPPPFLVEGVLQRGGFGINFGPPGCGKTLFAQGLAYSVGLGIPFLGKSTNRAAVLYIAGEGSAGLGPRVSAWRGHYGIPPGMESDVRFITEAPQLLQDADVTAVIEAITSISPTVGLVILDTMSRCLVGSDENSAMEMGRLVAAIDRIRRETGAAVLVLHHANSSELRERGSTVPRGAADTVLSMSADGPIITADCVKQREFAPFERMTLYRKTIEFEDGSSSCVLTHVDEAGQREPTQSDRQALEALRSSFDGEGASLTAWKDAAGLPGVTFYRAQSHLQTLGLVQKASAGNNARYQAVQEFI